MTYLDCLAKRILDRVPQSEIPDEPNIFGLFRIYAVLLLAKGASIESKDVHNAWVAWMLGIDPRHPSLIPFAELDDNTAADDMPYVQAIMSIAEEEALNSGR